MLYFATVIALCGVALAGPITMGGGPIPLKGLEPMESDCVTQCVAEFRSETVNVEFAKTTDYGSQLVNLNKTCRAFEEGQACIAKCNTFENPLDIPAMRVMCDDGRRAEVAKHETCYTDKREHVNMICDEKCGAHLISPVDFDGKRRKPTLEETATACTRSRCHATCSRDSYIELCAQTDPEAGLYLQQFFIEVLDAVNQGLQQAGLMPFVLKTLPKECHVMFSPLEFFGLGSAPVSNDQQRTPVGFFEIGQ